MKMLRRSLAALEITLIFPAVLFMTALFVRSIQPIQFEPARTAQQIVDWYAARPHIGLWLLLIAMPLLVFASGLSWLAHQWRRNQDLRSAMQMLISIARSHASALLVACASAASACILAVVAMHLLTN